MSPTDNSGIGQKTAAMSGDSSLPKPFEWLSGGLFFGKGKGNVSSNGIASVDACTDVSSLLNGMNENLSAYLKEMQSERAKSQAEGQACDGGVEEAAKEEDAAAASGAPPSEPTQAEFLASRLSRVRFLLYDERTTAMQEGGRRSSTNVAGSVARGFADPSLEHLVPQLVGRLHDLPFEGRKHFAAIFNYLLVCGLEGADGDVYTPAMEAFRNYVAEHFDEILTSIVSGHGCSHPGMSDCALHCGSMYRSCFKHALLYQELVCTSDRVERYILPFLDTFVHFPNFDVSSDAMESLRLVLTAGCDVPGMPPASNEETQQQMAEMSAELLNRDYESIWDQRFNPKLLSDQANYMTRRMALQILSAVLLTRSNYAVMIRYVNSRDNLILVMHLLRDVSPHITLDAFHVFKVFVANPSKIPEVTKILKANSEKLCLYLESLHKNKEGTDPQFRDEKALIVATIRGL